MLPLAVETDTLSICAGDSILLGNQWVQTEGVYTDTILSLPCNTIRSTFLSLRPGSFSESALILCPGDSVWLDNRWIIAPDEIELLYQAANGCDSVAIISITELEAPIAPNATIDCINLEVVVTIEATAPWEIRWDNGDTSNTSTYAGGEEAVVSLSSVLPPCERSFRLSLPSLPALSNIATFQDTSIREGHRFSLDLNLNPSEWSVIWSPSGVFSCGTCMNTVVFPLENTIVDFYYTHQSGCRYQNSFEISLEAEGGLYIPNVFSPNRDGFNDQWRVLPPKGVAEFDEVLIFSRWGSLVASWKGIPEISWDGTFKGELMNPGVFVYYIRYTNVDGEQREKKGDVTILR